jgi:hypothetical protein
VEESAFAEGGTQDYEKEKRFRLEEARRNKAQNQMRGILVIAGPIALLAIGGLVFVLIRKKNGKAHFHAMHRELKRAEAKRRSGGGTQVMDPRQW